MRMTVRPTPVRLQGGLMCPFRYLMLAHRVRNNIGPARPVPRLSGSADGQTTERKTPNSPAFIALATLPQILANDLGAVLTGITVVRAGQTRCSSTVPIESGPAGCLE